METAGELVSRAKERVENVGADQIENELEQGAALIDLREPEELDRTGMIPGAVHVPRGMLEFRADPTSPYHDEVFDRSRRIILHCASGGRSALAAATLMDMGYENVAHLDGGITAWTDSGRATEPQSSQDEH